MRFQHPGELFSEWFDFRNFLRDMGERPENHDLRRVDSSGSFHPQNCQWVPITRGHGAARREQPLSPEYKSWASMRQRCNNPELVGYHNYGGRGITVCERWDNFANFLADMGPRPSEEHSLDRIDNDGNYCPENCRWATRVEQANNRRFLRNLTFEGRTMSLWAWAREIGLSPSSLAKRINSGWDVRRALTLPAGQVKPDTRFVTFNGETLTYGQWAERYGLPYHCLRKRLESGWPIEEALQTPSGVRGSERHERRITWSGETLKLSEWERRLGLPDGRLYQRLWRGWSIERALTTPAQNCGRRASKT